MTYMSLEAEARHCQVQPPFGIFADPGKESLDNERLLEGLQRRVTSPKHRERHVGGVVRVPGTDLPEVDRDYFKPELETWTEMGFDEVSGLREDLWVYLWGDALDDGWRFF